MIPDTNVDSSEIAKFDAQARYWWDPNGALKALHDINGLRLNYVRDRSVLKGKNVLDVGCGGGIFSEALAATGAAVTGLDMSEMQLAVARQHAGDGGLAIDFHRSTVETHAAENPGVYDVVSCMELLEHVPDPGSIVSACGQLVKPGGDLFFATLNRTFLSFFLAIIAAEYLFRLVPRGTHQYNKFVTPEELKSWVDREDLEFVHLTGFSYLPVIRRADYCKYTSVNYLAHARKPGI
ncbi:MAG: bifunctional 2-polyprenyl-6-hydroxyphenol methylase/3-demethylubiquinol 3-O-methyltransferase UbiG [Desulfobacteraceae bacterium]|nr:bifunctional 2-polyprenyl-6-hydroxyphenol methylase/3-demethylubiquinol 3-O-methyltransferase UbiG [Desulfobacteraceae bacterium]